MSSLTRKLITVLAMVILVIGGCVSRDAGRSGDVVNGEIAQKVDDYLTRLVPFGFSGAALVARGDKVLLNKGYGLAIVADSTPNDSRTIFSTGSITKQFTAAAIMKLEMMGKLNTDDPISKYFENVPEEKQSIRLHHLLTHTAGFPGALGSDFEIVDREEMMKRILEAPLKFPPGEEFGYSNCGYSMLAAIVELASEMTYEEFLQEHLFKPAGMEYTGYRLPDWSGVTVAHWYAGDIDNGIPLDKDYPYWNYIGNGGILSTAGDMLKWHLALTGDKVLSAEARAKLYTPFLNDYAYGWDVLDTERGTLIQHDGGSMLGCAADFKRYVDSSVTIVLFSNRSGSEFLMDKGVRNRVADLVFGGEFDLPLRASNQSINLIAHEGNFLLENDAAYLVTSAESGLQITPYGKDAITGLYITGDSLLNEVKNNEKRSTGVLSAAIKEDFEPFRVLINDDQRLERIKRLWYMRLNRYAEMTGPLTEAVAKFSWPSGYEPGATETVMEIQGQKSGFFYLMIWKDGNMIGIAPTMAPNIGPLTLLPIGDHQFFTYDIGAARNIRVTFDDSSMTILGEGGNLKAVRAQ
ncbi:MAG: beta-lactamase family protein [Candidatus Zixiibacteriota bacterium]|nr:MAG: beta-lactamase family protein [candidate division Zixibacteria bacterium]